MAENRRVRMTKRLMKDALLELLEVKPLEKITVTDVCAAADVNRSSFYAHYQDIHALLRELEDEVLEHIPVPEGPIGADSAFPAALELYFDHVQQNARLFRALILRREDARFDRRLVDAVMARNRPCSRSTPGAMPMCSSSTASWGCCANGWARAARSAAGRWRGWCSRSATSRRSGVDVSRDAVL